MQFFGTLSVQIGIREYDLPSPPAAELHLPNTLSHSQPLPHSSSLFMSLQSCLEHLAVPPIFSVASLSHGQGPPVPSAGTQAGLSSIFGGLTEVSYILSRAQQLT